MLEIIPAIMPKDFTDLQKKAGMVYKNVKTIHIDVMNGSITHSKNWPFTADGLTDLEKIKKGELALPFWKEVNYEVDIMMENPEDSIAEWVNAGFRRVIIHIENVKKVISTIKEWKDVVELGIAVGVETSNDEVYKYIDEGIDFLQFMGIYQIGFQGNPFDARVIEKVKTAREVFSNLPISVDGSVNMETAKQLITAGANRLVIGSAIFNKKAIIPADVDIQSAQPFSVGDDLSISDIYSKQDIGPEEALKEFKKLAV
jgi:ribulose-phosphate 3-epimerase